MPNPLAIKKQTTDPDAMRANILHNFITEKGFATIKAMVGCGEILAEKKASLAHGRWLPWVKSNLEFTERTTQYYLRLYAHREQILREQPESLVLAIALLSDTKRITPGLVGADEMILRQNIVQPIKVVRKRLKYLPRDTIHYETLTKLLDELQHEIDKLISTLYTR